MRCCTYLRVSSVEQNNGVALERMLFDAQVAAQEMGGEIPPEMIFFDTISGRKNDRPDFTSIWGLIESRAIDAVIFYRVDRMGRDAELLLKLGKLFERTGVKAYVCERNKFLDWKDLEDWDYWTRSSVAAERESRVISGRLIKAHQFNQYKQQASFCCPMGYRRNSDRRYEPDPEEWDIATRMLEIIEEEKCNLARSVIRIERELGQIWTRRGLKDLIDNPVLRGHTAYKRRKNMLYHTHSGYDRNGENYDPAKDFRLLTEERYQLFKGMLKDRAMYRGTNAGKAPYPLTGLVNCVCGAICTISKTERDGRTYTYFRCRAGEEKWRHIQPHSKRTINYETIEKSVMDYMAGCADRIVDTVLEVKENPPTPEILKKIAHIEYLQSGIQQFGDPTGEQGLAIARLKAEIAESTRSQTVRAESIELRERLQKLSNPEIWYGATRDELRRLFTTFIEQVLIDCSSRQIAVKLNPLLLL